MAEENNKSIRPPSLLDALTPIIFLIILLASAVFLYGADGIAGPIQVALMLSMMVAGIVGLKNGHQWEDMGKAAVDGISQAMGAIFILLGVGALIGTWTMAGTIATIVHYGVQFLDPNWYYLACTVICGVLALSIGSAWTVAGTLGVGLIGIANLLGVSPEITAGAVISGAYFGDKMSPLSETTNLAPAVAGSDLFTHIKNMLWTTAPSIVIALLIFGIIGLSGVFIAAMAFGGVMEYTGLLARLIQPILKWARGDRRLLVATGLTSIGINLVAGDQYMAIVLPGRMYRDIYNEKGIAPETLSRQIEDTGTITSPLIPWNSCGAYMSATLGIATFAYLPYCFFNLINVAISLIYAALGFQIKRIKPDEAVQEIPEKATLYGIGGHRVEGTEHEAAVTG